MIAIIHAFPLNRLFEAAIDKNTGKLLIPVQAEYFVPDVLKEERVECCGRFLKMIDDLQTPKYKTNHK